MLITVDDTSTLDTFSLLDGFLLEALTLDGSDASEEPSVTFELPDRTLAIEDLFDDVSPFAVLSAQEHTDSKIGVATTTQRIRKTIGFFIIIFSPFGFVILGKGHQGLFYPIFVLTSCLSCGKET